jgi:hypothetical protein
MNAREMFEVGLQKAVKTTPKNVCMIYRIEKVHFHPIPGARSVFDSESSRHYCLPVWTALTAFTIGAITWPTISSIALVFKPKLQLAAMVRFD